MFLTDDTPSAIVDSCHAKLRDESYLAFLDMLVPPMRRPTVHAPVLVVGASDDAIISAGDVRRTARDYDTQAELFDGMGHDMTLGPGWEGVADRVDAWVRRFRSTKDAA
jgi:pimeloyl-ACP methyl ester carboxylesterase